MDKFLYTMLIAMVIAIFSAISNQREIVRYKEILQQIDSISIKLDEMEDSYGKRK